MLPKLIKKSFGAYGMNKKSAFRHVAVKTAALLICFGAFAFCHTPAMMELRRIPGTIYAESETELYEKLGEYSSGGLVIAASASGGDSLGGRKLALSLPSGIKVGEITAFVGERPRVIPGGEPVGVSIYTEGVLVVGLSDFKTAEGKRASPAADAGLKPGDVIMSVSGKLISTSEELTAALSGQEPAELMIDRGGKRSLVTVCPQTDEKGSLRIGAWVRDSTVGIGTLTFLDPESGAAAALGHPVADADTGSLLKVRDGRLVQALVVGVTKGLQGAPGELHGSFGPKSPAIAKIRSNTELGIFGDTEPGAASLITGEAVEIAFPDEVRRGEAVILCAASGSVEEYSCVIRSVSRQSSPEEKGLVIEITDERLISLTGGVVQGMSGSPIIQGGRLVGAVTHVFVNDPLKGYGAYAYWMYLKAREEG